MAKNFIDKFSIPTSSKHFSSGLFQNYLEFIPAKKYIKYFSDSTWIDLWKSNGMPEKNIENITKSDSNFAPTFIDQNVLHGINFNKNSLIINIYILKNSKYIFFTH